jgi:hypothetical protein
LFTDPHPGGTIVKTRHLIKNWFNGDFAIIIDKAAYKNLSKPTYW